MAKIKLLRFELSALIEESKKLLEYLQCVGATQIEKVNNENLLEFETQTTKSSFEASQKNVQKAISILEENCNLKKSFFQSFSDFTEMDYTEFKDFASYTNENSEISSNICRLNDEISALKADIIRYRTFIDYYEPWKELDIPMSSTGTSSCKIFIGNYKSLQTVDSIKSMLAQTEPELDGYEVEIISSSKVQTCIVFICHTSDSEAFLTALKKTGFESPERPAKAIVKNEIVKYEKLIDETTEKIELIKQEILKYAEKYEKLRILNDYYSIQIERCNAFSLTGATDKTIYIEGFIPERESEAVKFKIERDFTAQMELFEPDLDNEDVPVLIENNAFAGGVENISNMYSPPSNKDVDPNPIMAFFYYALFGLMLSDGGYGLLMVFFALVAKYKFKVRGGTKKTADFAFFCGLSSIIWGAMFGSWFGDLIPTICTTFFKMTDSPNLAIWFDPKDDSMKLLLFSFLFGIIHLFTGLAIHFYNLCKRHDFFGAFCDVVPIYVFVTGFAIIGKNFIEPVSDQARSVGTKLLTAGAVLIIFTAGRSAKNIFGKLGGGLYGLYNTTTGYLGDILSYSRLLALNLVTSVIAIVVNLLAAMPKNIIFFVIVFLAGHGINFAINLIGTYVHTNRLQYVEYFSKFYEGGGRLFKPFKLNSKFIKFKEDTINE